jgi:hypothetical protein
MGQQPIAPGSSSAGGKGAKSTGGVRASSSGNTTLGSAAGQVFPSLPEQARPSPRNRAAVGALIALPLLAGGGWLVYGHLAGTDTMTQLSAESQAPQVAQPSKVIATMIEPSAAPRVELPLIRVRSSDRQARCRFEVDGRPGTEQDVPCRIRVDRGAELFLAVTRPGARSWRKSWLVESSLDLDLTDRDFHVNPKPPAATKPSGSDSIEPLIRRIVD